MGLVVGSFLNVCISRLPRQESIIQPRSRCPSCHHPIRWRDNIPLVSWILLRGHCRDCGGRISARYPLVELATALWFALQAARLYTVILFYSTDQSLTGSSNAVFAICANLSIAVAGVFLIGLIFTDWQTGLLPNSLTWPGIFVGLLFVCVQAILLGPGEGQILLTPNSPKLTSAGATADPGNVFMTGPEALIMGRVAAVAGAALLLFAIRKLYKLLRHREGMGVGDIKLLAMITAFLGFWPAMLSLFLGAVGASLFGLYGTMRGHLDRSSKLPFGSFLGAGALLAAQVGDRLLDAYFRLLR